MRALLWRSTAGSNESACRYRSHAAGVSVLEARAGISAEPLLLWGRVRVEVDRVQVSAAMCW